MPELHAIITRLESEKAELEAENARLAQGNLICLPTYLILGAPFLKSLSPPP